MIKNLILLQTSLFLSISAGYGDTVHLNEERKPQGIKEQVDLRWNEFKSNREFRPFRAGRSDEELNQEFENLRLTRKEVWKTPGYEIAQYLLEEDHVRAPNCVAFAYNNTDPNYNASTLQLNGRTYLASEGPRSKDVPNFFKLLEEQGVTHVVRLTDSYEGELKKCHPYWEGCLRKLSEGEGLLDIPVNQEEIRTLHAYDMAYWKDNSGIDPSLLLDQVLNVRKEIQDPKSLLLVHCSAGVGRTGTFLASIAILDAIDRNEPFSIEEITYYLSLQRVNSVAQPPQYVTLHRLAEIYLQRKADQKLVQNASLK